MKPQTPAERPQVAAGGRETGRKGHGAKSAPARERAILALLSERTMGRAATRCGVGERTLRRWLTEDSEFKAEYEAARSAMFQVGMSRIQALAGRAVETLEDLLGAKQYPAVRLGAARTVAEIGMHQYDQYDADTILRKLDQIEAAQRQRRQ
jgi:alpha-beta hydrolase superfamily lysophospholipase